MEPCAERQVRINRGADIAGRRRERQLSARKRTVFNHDPSSDEVRRRPKKFQSCDVLVADLNAKRPHARGWWYKIYKIRSRRNVTELECAVRSNRYFQNLLQVDAGKYRFFLFAGVWFRGHASADSASKRPLKLEVQILRCRVRADGHNHRAVGVHSGWVVRHA